MKNISENNTNIKSEGQNGGITAQNVTINNNYPLSQGLGKFKFKFNNKKIKWGFAIVVCGAFLLTISKGNIKTEREFYQFVTDYLKSVNVETTDANDWFAKNINTFYLEKNINPDYVNKIRKKSDYTNGSYNVDFGSIKLCREADGICYWRFKSSLICYRPTKQMYEKCDVEMEYGLNEDDKITSINQIRYWNLAYTKERPSW